MHRMEAEQEACRPRCDQYRPLIQKGGLFVRDGPFLERIEKLYCEKHDHKGVHGVENDVGQMIAQRVQSPDGIIKGIGYPCQRVPGTCPDCAEGPLDEVEGRGLQIGVCKDINIVIPIDKCIQQRREINEERCQGN